MLRDPKKRGCICGRSSVKSKVYFLVVSNNFIAAKDWGNSSCCFKIHPIPSADQSISRNTDLEPSCLSKRGEVTKFALQASNNEINFDVQKIRDIGF